MFTEIQITPKMNLGCEGGCALDDEPRHAPGFGQEEVAKPRTKRQMPGDQIWRKTDVGLPLMDN